MTAQAQARSRAAIRSQSVFGAADGTTIAVGLVVALHRHPGAMFAAAAGAGLAELAGMTGGAWLAGEGKLPAAANGGAAAAACMLPAVPYLVTSGTAALAAAVILALAIGAVIAWLRPEKGLLAVVETYGVLAAAAVLCWGASFL
jgi:hypothetical protein